MGLTKEELAAIGKARHAAGPDDNRWIARFAAELGFHRSTVWKAVRGRTPVTREIEQAVRLLPKRKARRTQPKETPHAE